MKSNRTFPLALINKQKNVETKLFIQQTSDTQPLLQSSMKKTPKKSTKTKKAPRAPTAENEDLDAIMPYEEPVNVSDVQTDKPASSPSENEQFKEIKPPTFTGEKLLLIQIFYPLDLFSFCYIFSPSIPDKISTFMSREQKQITAEIKQMMGGNNDTQTGLKRLQSLRRRNTEGVRKKEHSGDILTKVTIPRSGSFLNAGGLTRYKSKVTR